MAVPYKLIARERALDKTKASVHDHLRSARAHRRFIHKRWVVRNFVRKMLRKRPNQ